MASSPTPELAPLLSPSDTDRLRDALETADYTVDAVLERIGAAGQAGLGRNSTVPAGDALDRVDAADALDTLVRLFVLQQPVVRNRAEVSLPTDQLLEAGILCRVPDTDQVAAVIDIRPVDSPDDGATGWVVSDLTPGLDQRVEPMRPDYVLGVSPASTTLAQLTHRRPVGSALDLGTGCGIQSLHLARHAQRIVATDLNPRALQHAQLTAALNRIDLDLRLGSLYEPVADQRFDLIVTNPPYVMSPPRTDTTRLTYREGNLAGDGLVEHVVRRAPHHLTDGGMLQVLGNWAIVDGQPTDERLAGWVEGTGADLWVVERERLDVHEYVELWLTDAGLSTSDQWLPRYREWLDYFTHLGITGVGMGWITLTMAARATPDITVETWPWAVEQPVGAAIGRRSADLTAAATSDAEMLATHWLLRDDVVEETLGRPGAAGYEHIVLRQSGGFRRAIESDTAQAAILGACDGDLSLGEIIEAVARLLEVDAGALGAEQLPLFRSALREGFLDRRLASSATGG
ncbi:DUF7059 domain-containing protein [Aestuariimicrobium ganziense]|uniref:DUF7059 domain-containing protein n=1 Tax=Aestuariimicrobium ganziense TaxID=2773677 RepID=UPI00194428BF|nr:methyltransferase [Aestuariimicrobium ganziense]